MKNDNIKEIENRTITISFKELTDAIVLAHHEHYEELKVMLKMKKFDLDPSEVLAGCEQSDCTLGGKLLRILFCDLRKGEEDA